MMLAHRHAERPGHVPCVPGDGRPAQGVMRPHAPQAVVRPNQALRRLPRQGPPAILGRTLQGDLGPAVYRGGVVRGANHIG